MVDELYMVNLMLSNTFLGSLALKAEHERRRTVCLLHAVFYVSLPPFIQGKGMMYLGR